MEDRNARTMRRIEENITLLTALVGIGEGKQAVAKNRSVGILTLIATIFLPFGTVAAILGLQGEFAPGMGLFWVYWAAAVPITCSILGFSFFGERIGRGLGKLRRI